MNIEIIGFVAGFLTTICLIPQTIKALKASDTKSVSLVMYSLFTLGVSLWLIYGVMLHSLPIIICNTVSLPLSVAILAKKIKNVMKGID
jgi:MtN3 and saliva related transmembrane protein